MLHQQGTQRIEVIVKKEGGSMGGSANANETATEEVAGKETTWRTTIFGSENPQRIARVAKTNLTHFLAVANQVAQLAISYKIGGIGYEYGDQALQDNVQRNMEIVKDVTGFASSIGMGMMFGAWGGPIGIVVGGALGALSSGASTAFKYAGRRRDFNYKVFKENNSVQYQRARASISLTTGRLR